jgi:hypothetical protein
VSCIPSRWPSHRILWHLINLLMFSPLWLLIHRFIEFSIICFLSLVHIFSAEFSFQVLLMLFPLPWWVFTILNYRCPRGVPMCGISATCCFLIWGFC